MSLEHESSTTVKEAQYQIMNFEWERENQVLPVENVQDRSEVTRYTREIRVAHCFYFFRGNAPSYITPKNMKSLLGGTKFYGSVASLNGPSQYLIQAGEWQVEWKNLDTFPMKIEKISKFCIDRCDLFRDGAPSLCFYTARYIYFLLQPEIFFEKKWNACVVEWGETHRPPVDLVYKEVDENKPRPAWWKGKASWIAFLNWCDENDRRVLHKDISSRPTDTFHDLGDPDTDTEIDGEEDGTGESGGDEPEAPEDNQDEDFKVSRTRGNKKSVGGVSAKGAKAGAGRVGTRSSKRIRSKTNNPAGSDKTGGTEKEKVPPTRTRSQARISQAAATGNGVGIPKASAVETIAQKSTTNARDADGQGDKPTGAFRPCESLKRKPESSGVVRTQPSKRPALTIDEIVGNVRKSPASGLDFQLSQTEPRRVLPPPVSLPGRALLTQPAVETTLPNRNLSISPPASQTGIAYNTESQASSAPLQTPSQSSSQATVSSLDWSSASSPQVPGLRPPYTQVFPEDEELYPQSADLFVDLQDSSIDFHGIDSFLGVSFSATPNDSIHERADGPQGYPNN